jgi:galactose-1-phosphate uridylyltransferase
MTTFDSARQITNLDGLVAKLPPETQALFTRIFYLSAAEGQTVPPEEMYTWLEGQFGSVEAVKRQRIIKVTNLVTMEGTVFNELRSRRPIEAPTTDQELEDLIQSSAGGPFCYPEISTPADTFGRLRSDHAITASNVAKYDGWHGVIIFDEHHPLRFTAEQVADYVQIAQRWAQTAHEADGRSCYPFFLWNCLWKAGASILHGHAQMVLTRDMHYARVERWRRVALEYQEAHGGNYFSDLISVHQALGLAIIRGAVTILASLTPYKEKETLIISQELDGEFISALYHVLDTFCQQLGVHSFNLAVYQPPLAATPESWDHFPVIARIVDRGDLYSRTTDIAAMEIFGQSVVATDPFRLVAALSTNES